MPPTGRGRAYIVVAAIPLERVRSGRWSKDAIVAVSLVTTPACVKSRSLHEPYETPNAMLSGPRRCVDM